MFEGLVCCYYTARQADILGLAALILQHFLLLLLLLKKWNTINGVIFKASNF